MRPAVVLSAHVMGLAVIRGLGEGGIPIIAGCYEGRDMGSVSRFVQKCVRLPHPVKEEAGFIDALTDLGRSLPRPVLFPADDATLSAVSRHREVLSESYLVACMGAETVKKFISKQYTYELAQRLGVPAPVTFVPSSRDEAVAQGAELGFPCLVKPCESHLYFEVFRRKMTRVDGPEELLRAYDEARAWGLEVMVQELVPGDDGSGVNYNCLMLDGEPAAEFTAQKVRLSPPAFGVPRVVVSRRIAEVIPLGRALLKGMGFAGFACTEFKRDARSGEYKLMEINGRHNRSGMLAIRCGMNFPLMEYGFHASGDHPTCTSFKEGMFWIDDIKDVVDSCRYWRSERYGLGQLLRPYRGPKVYAVLDWDDPQPWIKRCFDLLRRPLQDLGTRLITAAGPRR